jgi:exopolysaccharide biosynthesis polyprenyl glycosylphosphotransferase
MSTRTLASPPDVDERGAVAVEARVRTTAPGRRGWLMRRLLLAADVVGLAVAFVVTEVLFGSKGHPDTFNLDNEIALFFIAIPIFVLGSKLFGLYDHDEEHADHSTSDELSRVFLLATVGVFLVTRGVSLIRPKEPDLTKMTVFWLLLFLCISCARVAARTLGRRSPSYVQNTIIVGAGSVGQLVGRKLLQHREYKINLLGFVDDQPTERRADLGDLTILGTPDQLGQIAEQQRVDRVIVAFSNDRHEKVLPLVRSLRDAGIQVDVVPRLFEVVGPRVSMHTVEGMPLVGLPPLTIPRSSRAAKRLLDVVGALIALVIAIPFFVLAAIAIRLESRGPVFFRQRRLGRAMREFTLLKFRTMRVDTDESTHRAYIDATMRAPAAQEKNELFKLDRSAEITRVGRWLRRTSLDELPQLLNVLSGDMSLVGPRPCLPYEVRHFAPHHFDRFLVPAGLTGLWQVSARAHSPFGEALDLDVLYAQSWSFGLDLSLLARTPVQLLRPGGTA